MESMESNQTVSLRQYSELLSAQNLWLSFGMFCENDWNQGKNVATSPQETKVLVAPNIVDKCHFCMLTIEHKCILKSFPLPAQNSSRISKANPNGL